MKHIVAVPIVLRGLTVYSAILGLPWIMADNGSHAKCYLVFELILDLLVCKLHQRFKRHFEGNAEIRSKLQ